MKTWNITVLDKAGNVVTEIEIDSPTKTLAVLSFRKNYVQFWGWDFNIKSIKHL
jgi:hypothetical protein